VTARTTAAHPFAAGARIPRHGGEAMIRSIPPRAATVVRGFGVPDARALQEPVRAAALRLVDDAVAKARAAGRSPYDDAPRTVAGRTERHTLTARGPLGDDVARAWPTLNERERVGVYARAWSSLQAAGYEPIALQVKGGALEVVVRDGRSQSARDRSSASTFGKP
jgi:hypothetical protein